MRGAAGAGGGGGVWAWPGRYRPEGPAPNFCRMINAGTRLKVDEKNVPGLVRISASNKPLNLSVCRSSAGIGWKENNAI